MSPEAMVSPEFGRVAVPPQALEPMAEATSVVAPERRRLGRNARAALGASFRAAAARAAARHGVSVRQGRGILRPLRVFDVAYIGLVVTVLVVFATYEGWLSVPEQWSFDLRTRFAEYGRPAPTKTLVHLDLDDQSMEDIGRWPWSRSVQALLLEELAAAEPRAVALDILYDAPEKLTYEPVGDGKFAVVDHDKQFATAIRGLGNVIIAYSHDDIEFVRPDDTVYGRVVNILISRPAMEEEELQRHFPAEEWSLARKHFRVARKEAVSIRVARYMAERVRTLDEVFGLISSNASAAEVAAGPSTAPAAATTRVAGLVGAGGALGAEGALGAGAIDGGVIEDSPLRRIVADVWAHEIARRAIAPFGIPGRSEVMESLDDRKPSILPVAAFAEASSLAAFVTYNKGGDGIMRRVPLVMNAEGRASMSLGLALALKTLGVKPSEVSLRDNLLVIPAPAGDIRVPLRRFRFNELKRETAGVLDLPFIGRPGASTWLAMYDEPGDEPRFTVSASKLWQAVQVRARIAANNASLREAALTMLGETNSPQQRRTWDPHDATAWTAFAGEMLELNAADIEALDASPPSQPAELPPFATTEQKRDREDALRAFKLHRAANAARLLPAHLRDLADEARTIRAELRELIAGRAVLVGWTATGRTDFVATPMHPACAGVRIHGLVYNAIVTGNFLRFAPQWLGLVLTLAMGLFATWAVVRWSPLAALLGVVVLAGAYVVGAAALFGPLGYVLLLAPPLLATAAAWASASVAKFVVERAERNRILKRFQTYVDPQLVNYLLANPERARLDGERRRMTVCFTDLAGFTSLSEKLGEQTVGMLNEYFALMVPLVRKHKGYVNKLLGDGMMFFFNAPQPNELHAASAFNAVLEMQQVMQDFNQGLVERGLPTLKMRVGITTGEMIAGDAGGGGYNDFTVLGDVVNLSSRLEGANKASGTLILCNRESLEAAGAEFLSRPVGVLRVVGKTEGIETFEVMARVENATERQRHLARLTSNLIQAYQRADLESCIRIADHIDEDFGTTKISDLYRNLCNQHIVSGLPVGFDGTIVLETK